MNNNLHLYVVDPEYLKFLHKLDYRVTIKFKNRPYVGVITMINDIKYVLPLTSRTTKLRQQSGKKKRPAKTTTFVRDSSGEEIANILHNNMIPVTDNVIKKIDIDPLEDTFESNEIRFIRKHSDRIIAKTNKVYNKRIEKKDPYLKKICCNFKKLEKNYSSFSK